MNGVALLCLQVPTVLTESGSRTDKHWDLSKKERPWFPELSTKIWGNHTGLTSAKRLPTSFSISPLLGRLEKTVQTACFVFPYSASTLGKGMRNQESQLLLMH